MTSEVEYTNPAGVHSPTGPYSHVVRVPAGADMFYLSGQFGVRPDGSVGEGVYEQTDQAFKNLMVLLKSQGMTAHNIVKLTTFIVAGQDSREVRRARLKHLGSHLPASTAVFVARLVSPDWLVAVDAIAVKLQVAPK
ncbi:MAG: RidA family protein [Steroidobacteraceae bacterium]